MALSAAQRVTNAGIAPTYSVPLASDEFAWPGENPGFVLMHVKNANASPCVVTVTSQASPSDGLAAADKAVTVPATTGDRFIRVGQSFRDATGAVSVTFSEQTSVSVALLYVL
jgi:hypothetical protein